MNTNLSKAPEQVHRDRAATEMMKLFEELSFKQRTLRTFRGLNQSSNSGDYKFAKLQIQLLAGPILAFIIPLICIGILLSIETTEKKPGTGVPVDLIDATKPPDLKDPPPQEEEKIKIDLLDNAFDGPAAPFNLDQNIKLINNEALSPKPSDRNTVSPIKSPIIMTGILALRDSGHQGEAVKEGGGKEAGQKSLMCALRWLKSKQNPNGSWPGQPTAMTGLALLTFLAHGETPSPDCAEFGPTVEKGIRYLVENQKEDGLFASKDGNNYAHPIATYALCEAWTMTKVPMLKVPAEKALGHIVRGQHPNGGWDYNMRQTERDDTSYMGWCAQAIKAGHMAGDLEVENLEKAYNNAINGFKINATPSGGFGYVGKGKTGLTGVGLLCMQLLGAGNDKEVSASLAFLSECTYSFETWAEQPYGGNSPVYYWYYITQAKFHAGRDQWKNWNKIFEPELIKRLVVLKDVYKDPEGKFRDIGYWDSPSPNEFGNDGGEKGTAIRYKNGSVSEEPTSDGKRVQDTTLSALQLMVYYRYLPTFRTPQVVQNTDDGTDKGEIEIKIIM